MQGRGEAGQNGLLALPPPLTYTDEYNPEAGHEVAFESSDLIRQADGSDRESGMHRALD